MWIPLDTVYSLRRIDLTIKYRQPTLPCFKLCFVLPTRLDTYGVRRLFHMQNYHIQTNGAERRGKWDIVHVCCYVYSLPLCYFTQSALPNYQTGCCSVLHVLLCPAKRIRRAAHLFVQL